MKLDKKKFLVDGDYFIDLDNVTKAVCKLNYVTTTKKRTVEKYIAVCDIEEIDMFYIDSYHLITKDKYDDKTKHEITQYLRKNKAFVKNTHSNNSYKVTNIMRKLFKFNTGNYPYDLFFPIQIFVNGLFTSDLLFIDFEVEYKNDFKIIGRALDYPKSINQFYYLHN